MKKSDFEVRILKVMPWLPTVVSRMVRRLRQFDGREPATLMAQIENDVIKIAERVKRNPKVMLKGLLSLFKHRYFKSHMAKTMQVCVRIVEEQASADPRALELERLIDEADARVPYVSWLVLQHHVDFRNQFRPICMASTLLEDARKATGELKASLLIDALGKMSEVLYHPYLLALWQLTCFAQGRWPTRPEFGSLVIELSQRLADYPGLVDRDARWMRNSSRHERWEPVPGENAIIMWDEKTPATRFSLDELESKVNAMFQMAGVTFGAVARSYLFKNMLANTGAWDAMEKTLPAALNAAGEDLSNSDAVDQEMESEMGHVREKFAPLNAFILAKCPEAAIVQPSVGQ